MNREYSFRYRDFHDIPRMIVVKVGERYFLLDCPFNDDLDEYPDHFVAYALSSELGADVGNMRDWRPLPSMGKRLGVVPVEALTFDATRRQTISGAGMEIVFNCEN